MPSYVMPDVFFTFQSGYIQIKWVYKMLSELRTLHSNLIIFKYLYLSRPSQTYPPLHSNLVIFKFSPADVAELRKNSLHSNLVIFK